MVPTSAAANTVTVAAPAELDVAQVYGRHADFLWKSLHRMGVRDADLPDAMQEVLLVVHRRLGSFDRSSKLTTWLFGVCLRVASTMRRGHSRRRETPMAPGDRVADMVDDNDPERLLEGLDAQRRLSLALDSLDPEKRALLVLFELEEVPCAELSELLGVPVGTVHSRLFAARQLFHQALLRLDARDRRARDVSGGSK